MAAQATKGVRPSSTDVLFSYFLHRTGSRAAAAEHTRAVLDETGLEPEQSEDGLIRLFARAYHRLAAEGQTVDSPATPVLDRTGDERVEAAFSGLTPDQQHVLLLRYSRLLSNAGIGRTIGRDGETAKALIREALQALRRALEGGPAGVSPADSAPVCDLGRTGQALRAVLSPVPMDAQVEESPG